MTGWLRCRISPGMFRNEVSVTYPDLDKWQKSVFVPRTFIRNVEDHRGQVQVDYYQKDGSHFAVIPSAQLDIVHVESADHLERADHVDR